MTREVTAPPFVRLIPLGVVAILLALYTLLLVTALRRVIEATTETRGAKDKHIPFAILILTDATP